MSETITSDSVDHSEFALEMILTKGFGISDDFTGYKGDKFILNLMKFVEKNWDIFHVQEYVEKTKRANEFIIYNSLGDRLMIGEIFGSRGFYAKVEYIPPNAANIPIPVPIESEGDGSGGIKLVSANLPPSALNRKAQIRVSIPLNKRVEGLESIGTTELNTMRDNLSLAGYKLNVYKT